MWDTSTWTVLYRLKNNHDVTALSFDPSNRSLAVGDNKGYISILASFDPVYVSRVLNVDAMVSAIAYSPDSRYIAAGSYDGDKLMVFEPITGNILIKRDVPVRSLAYRWDGEQFLVLSERDMIFFKRDPLEKMIRAASPFYMLWILYCVYDGNEIDVIRLSELLKAEFITVIQERDPSLRVEDIYIPPEFDVTEWIRNIRESKLREIMKVCFKLV